MLIVGWICIDSHVSNIYLGGIFQSIDKQLIDRMQEMKRHWSSLLRCLRNLFDKTLLTEVKVMKLHHSYQKIDTSSQQTYTSQVSMKMWSKVDQENPKKKIQLHCWEHPKFLFQTMRSIIINKKFYCSRRKLWKNKSWNCVVCSPNKMAEVVVKSIQKWDHTSRCHLQDHEIWLAAILFGC